MQADEERRTGDEKTDLRNRTGDDSLFAVCSGDGGGHGEHVGSDSTGSGGVLSGASDD